MGSLIKAHNDELINRPMDYFREISSQFGYYYEYKDIFNAIDGYIEHKSISDLGILCDAINNFSRGHYWFLPEHLELFRTHSFTSSSAPVSSTRIKKTKKYFNPNSAPRYVNKHHQNHVNHVSPRDRSIRANHASDSIFTAEEEDESNDSESQYISDDQCDSIDNLSDNNDMHQDNDTIGSNDGGSCANNEEDYDDGNEDYDCYDNEGCYDDGDDDCYDDGGCSEGAY